EGFPAPLPLNADGSAREHPSSEAGLITDPVFWRTPDRRDRLRLQEPESESGYARPWETRRDDALLGSVVIAARVPHFSTAVRRRQSARYREVDGRPLQ